MCQPLDSVHAGFMSIVPRIQLHGEIVFRGVNDPDKRDELVAEMVALCWVWFQRLAQQGKDGSQFPSALARFAAQRIRCGRRLCGREPPQDVISPRAQKLHGFSVGSMSVLAEALQDNTRTPPPDAAAFRCDFPAWRSIRSDRDRRLIDELMQGERTRDLAGRFGVSEARISQLRRDLHDDWERFCEEKVIEDRPDVAIAA
jgi:hypothetical protein